MFSILAVAIVLAKLVAGITINITSPSVYRDTFISPYFGHIGAGINLALIDAYPDSNFNFTHNANSADTETVEYPLGNYDQYFGMTGYSDTPDLYQVWISGDDIRNLTVESDGEIKLTGGVGNWLFCSYTDSYYGNFTALYYFNNTGTPANQQCVITTIAKG